MKVITGKVAAVTGAGSGIGQHIAILLAKEGCDLALSDINEAGLAETVELLKNANVKVTSKKVDVSKLAQVSAWAKAAEKEHGKVNIIVNNAGVAMGSTVEGMSYADLKWMMDINFWGVVYGTKEFLPLLKRSGDGHIVNISSLFGLTSQPSQSAYNASKFAVRGFTEALRQELDIQKCGVSSTCVHPGGIRTNIANAARKSDSVSSLGMDIEKSSADFNKMLRIPPEEAARQIVQAIRHDQRRLLIGNDAKFLDLVQRLMPQGYQKIVGTAMKMQSRASAKKK
jgi:short-subunit dehydrogenase